MRIPSEEELDDVAYRLGARLEALSLALDAAYADNPKRWRYKAERYERWVKKWVKRGRR